MNNDKTQNTFDAWCDRHPLIAICGLTAMAYLFVVLLFSL